MGLTMMEKAQENANDSQLAVSYPRRDLTTNTARTAITAHATASNRFQWCEPNVRTSKAWGEKFTEVHDRPYRGFDLSERFSTLERGSKAPRLCACNANKPWAARLNPT